MPRLEVPGFEFVDHRTPEQDMRINVVSVPARGIDENGIGELSRLRAITAAHLIGQRLLKAEQVIFYGSHTPLMDWRGEVANGTEANGMADCFYEVMDEFYPQRLYRSGLLVSTDDTSNSTLGGLVHGERGSHPGDGPLILPTARHMAVIFNDAHGPRTMYGYSKLNPRRTPMDALLGRDGLDKTYPDVPRRRYYAYKAPDPPGGPGRGMQIYEEAMLALYQGVLLGVKHGSPEAIARREKYFWHLSKVAFGIITRGKYDKPSEGEAAPLEQAAA